MDLSRGLTMKVKLNDAIGAISIESIQGNKVSIPHPQLITHLQFRRFAGCPMCNLHIQSFISRYSEIADAGIQEVAIFHSSQESMARYHAEAPFALIADPTKVLYKDFGVETAFKSVFNPRTWPVAIRGILKYGAGLPSRGESPLGLPADFLIDSTAKVVAVHYGKHAYDQWEVDEVLSLVKSFT